MVLFLLERKKEALIFAHFHNTYSYVSIALQISSFQIFAHFHNTYNYLSIALQILIVIAYWMCIALSF